MDPENTQKDTHVEPETISNNNPNLQAESTPNNPDLEAPEPVPTMAAPQKAESRSEPDFKQAVVQYQLQLEDEFRRFEESLTQQPRDHDLSHLDWNDLEDRYQHEMDLQLAAEQEIMNDFSARFKQFMLWMQISNEKEAERATKRLRTRIAFVQNSEDQYAAKQEHYTKVLKAFQDAMSLLNTL